MAEVKEKKKRTPRSYESISNGALKMPLEDMIVLFQDLEKAIKDELKKREERLDQGKSDFERLSKLVNGTAA